MTRSRLIRACAAGAVIFLAAALCVPAFPRLAAAEDGIELLEDALLTDHAEGNYRRFHERLEAMLLKFPAHPVSVLYYPSLFQLAELVGPAAVDATAEKIRDALSRSGEEKAPAALLRLNCEIEKLRYRIDGEKGKRATDELKPVRRWTLFGPYHRYGPGDLEHRFQPETAVDGMRVSPEKKGVVTNYDGWLDPGRYLYPARGVIYARTSFYAEGAVKIRVCSDSLYKVFINGRPVVRNAPADRRSVRVIRVARASGVTVLVKLWGDPAQKLRLLITDDRDRSINPVREDEKTFSEESRVSEEPEYPGAAVMADTGARGDARRGMYCDGLGSDEALSWYRLALGRGKSSRLLFLLASALRAGAGTDRGTARSEEARLLLGEIRSVYPGYVPARHCGLGLLMDRGDYPEAYREGRIALSTVSRDPYSCLALLGLLDLLGRDREFLDTAARIRKEYADSPLLLKKMADFYVKRNSAARCAALSELLKKSFSPECARELIREYSARGNYESALDVINSHNYNNDFTRERIDVLVKKGDYDEARSVIFKALVTCDNPDYYQSLGLIDIARSDDPSMYFQKLLEMDRSEFKIKDYLAYINSGILENPFNSYRDVTVDEEVRYEKDPSCSPADVLYRGRVYLLNDDGSSRTYCEEIVRVNDESGADRWKRVRLPGRGEFRPVRVRVYDRSGAAAGSYSVSRVNNETYLQIGSVAKGVILHLSYLLDNAVPLAEKSGFFSMPPEFLQEYDEPVRRVSVTVVAPAGLKLSFMTSRDIVMKETNAGSLRQYTMSLSGLASVAHEPLPGGKQSVLPFLSFSTMNDPGDFVAWYNGLLYETHGPLGVEAGQFSGESVEKTVGSVYEFVTRETGLEQGGFGSPAPAGETLFRKGGSAEDRVVLARTLLDGLGIRSYLAFGRNKFLPGGGPVMNREYFSDMLLYVPLDAGRALWLDFSSPGGRCGVTAAALAETDALVIVSNSYYMKKIVSAESLP